MTGIVPSVILILCGALWIHLAGRNETMKAVTGNTRHFLKTALPGAGLIITGAVIALWGT